MYSQLPTPSSVRAKDNGGNGCTTNGRAPDGIIPVKTKLGVKVIYCGFIVKT